MDTEHATETKETRPPDQRLRLPALVEYRAAADVRRASAFCDVPEYVLGIEVLPLTPRTFSMLYAVKSHFIHGGQVTEGDVRNYLWFHSRLYAHCGVPDWQERKRQALRVLDRELNQPWRKFILMRPSLARYMAVLNLAIADIRGIIAEAFADSPPAYSSGETPIATLQAQVIHLFSELYGWAPEYTSAMPLRKLFQLQRCIRAARGRPIEDRGEQEIIADHLRRKNGLT